MGINLLDYAFFRFVFTNKLFVNLLRLLVLGLFVSAIAYGFIDPSQNNRVTVALMWGLFWPLLMVVTLASVGRFFCSICPLAFVGKYLNQIGSKKAMPQWLKNPFVGVGLLIIGYWLVYYSFPGFLRSAFATAIFFSVFTLLSLVMFYRYKQMAYCKSVCPISTVTRAFGKVGFTWLNTDQSRCASCKTFECAKACEFHLQPFRFDKKLSTDDCTLCMDCAGACSAVQFNIKKPAYAATLPFKPQKAEVWAILLITAAISITMGLHHALGRVNGSEHFFWVQSGAWLRQVTGVPATFDAVGFMAFWYAVLITVVLAVGGMWLAAKIMRLPFASVFYTLGYAFAPIFIVGGLSHLGEFFFYRYASSIANALIQLLHLNVAYVEPLAQRSDTWVHIFQIFKYIAMLWTAYLLYKRYAFLEATPKRKWLSVPFAAALLIFYVGLNAYTKYAITTYGMHGHHGHGQSTRQAATPTAHAMPAPNSQTHSNVQHHH